MRAEKVECTLSDCRVVGDHTEYHTVDLVFAYAPTVVRYTSRGEVTIEFDPPVDCERRYDPELEVSYLYCAPALSRTRIEFDRDGTPYLVEEEE